MRYIFIVRIMSAKITYCTNLAQKRDKKISEKCGFTKSHIWTTHVQTLMPGDARRCYNFCNVIMNCSEIQLMFFADIIWAQETQFLRNTMYNKQCIYFWSLIIVDVLSKVQHQIRLIE